MTTEDPILDPDASFPWWCQWDGYTQLVYAKTIEEARLIARQTAGPTVAVKARLATMEEAK